jgi:hypothetical protein
MTAWCNPCKWLCATPPSSNTIPQVPNAITAQTLRKADRGEDLVRLKNAADLFGKLEE